VAKKNTAMQFVGLIMKGVIEMNCECGHDADKHEWGGIPPKEIPCLCFECSDGGAPCPPRTPLNGCRGFNEESK
jgi:hypothetical protein